MVFCAEFKQCIFGLAISADIGVLGLTIDDASNWTIRLKPRLGALGTRAVILGFEEWLLASALCAAARTCCTNAGYQSSSLTNCESLFFSRVHTYAQLRSGAVAGEMAALETA